MAAEQQALPPIRLIPVQSTPETSAEVTDLRSERIQEFLQASNFAPNTEKAYQFELKRFMEWSEKAWHGITPRDLAQFKKYLKEECRTRKGKSLSPAAINQAMTALKSFYRWFQQAGYMSLSETLPTAGVKFEKLGDPLPRHLNPNQMEAIFQAVSGKEDIDLRDRALLAVLTHGLRAEDVSGLNVGNYDGVRLKFLRKKDKSDAIVPLRQEARKQIEAYLERRRSQQEELTEDSPLFLSYDFRSGGQRLGYQGIYYFTKIRLGTMLGIPDLTPHRFRHTYASELISLGIDSLLARSLTGHKSEKVFERYIKGRRLKVAEDTFFRAIGEETL
ncbi:MAG: tyrosine-type recombinase/integrase [Oscillatoriales cyanobacterium C42_A2020_001]|nr:tyrosine-type recombinase/integrase [Leptolyngbyaceae cyanobacterium C42_A2020_001]